MAAHSSFNTVFLLLVLTLAVVQSYVVNTRDDAQQAVKDSVDPPPTPEAYHAIFAAPKLAKSFLGHKRVRRGWGIIKKITGEEREEESESRENGREARHRAHLNSVCPTSCMGAWTGWSSCSVRCGSTGTQTSTRHPSPPAQCAGWVSSNGCPGPRTRTQACNRSCQNGGTLRPTDCACRPGFRGTCCETQVYCPFPGKPSHGSVLPDGSSHVYGTVARFSCDVGYTRQGGATRSCQGNGQWTGNVPTCQIVSCPDPGAPPHGSRAGTNFIYQQNVVYSCNVGFTLQGSATSTCGANGAWAPARPTCQEITCSQPDAPQHGGVALPNGRTYQKQAVYSCNHGYHLQGSNTRTCQLNTEWNGRLPTCQQIRCEVLPSLENGAVTNSGSDVGYAILDQVVTFSCNQGYELSGDLTRTCSGTGPLGTWTGSQPSCNPVSCGDPGIPSHGARRGGEFTFQSDVIFQCQPGYVIRGSAALTCLHTARWNVSIPTCEACPVSSYKLGSNQERQCTECPADSHTVGPASVSREQCLCNLNYTGSPGGPCTLITCDALEAPSNGSKDSCTNTVHSTCTLRCNEGYIRSHGDAFRTCTLNAQWNGTQPTCSPCPLNLYKETETRCTRCPPNTYTEAEGQGRLGCVCDAGYNQTAPGETCTDIDECVENNAGCAQTCSNVAGSYICSCTIPGYVINQDNKHLCIAKNLCPEPTSPDNGGLVCFQRQTTNTQRCQVKCNPGYEHLDRINAFEECGPSTNFLWTNEEALPCIAQFFPDTSVEAEVAYFVSACDSLSSEEIQEARQKFIAILRERGVCMHNGQTICDINQVEIECGPVVEGGFWRRKRDTLQFQLKFTFKLAGKFKEISVVNCSQECQIEKQAQQHEDLTVAVEQLKVVFGVVVSAPVNGTSASENEILAAGLTASLEIGGMVLHPSVVHVANITGKCAEGMEQTAHNTCVPCPPGTYTTQNDVPRCELCDVGAYQPSERQGACIPCPTVTSRGATTCPTPTTPPPSTTWHWVHVHIVRPVQGQQ